MKRLFVFRHGQTDWNAQGRIQGHLDIPLNDVGREQARRLIRPFQQMKIEAILSSDLSRAFESAQIIGEKLGIPVYSDSGLREIFLGEMQGLDRAEIRSRFGHEFTDRLKTDPLSDEEIISLGAETNDQVLIRTLGSVEKFLHAHPFQKIGIVSHGGVIRRLVQFGLKSSQFPPSITNGIIYPFTFDLHHRSLTLESHTIHL